MTWGHFCLRSRRDGAACWQNLHETWRFHFTQHAVAYLCAPCPSLSFSLSFKLVSHTFLLYHTITNQNLLSGLKKKKSHALEYWLTGIWCALFNLIMGYREVQSPFGRCWNPGLGGTQIAALSEAKLRSQSGFTYASCCMFIISTSNSLPTVKLFLCILSER